MNSIQGFSGFGSQFIQNLPQQAFHYSSHDLGQTTTNTTSTQSIQQLLADLVGSSRQLGGGWGALLGQSNPFSQNGNQQGGLNGQQGNFPQFPFGGQGGINGEDSQGLPPLPPWLAQHPALGHGLTDS